MVCGVTSTENFVPSMSRVYLGQSLVGWGSRLGLCVAGATCLCTAICGWCMAPPCRCGRLEAEADERGPIPTLIEEERRGGNPILPEHACIQQFLHAASSIARSECTECRDDIFASARVVVIGGKNRRREMNAHCQEARRCRSAETLSGRKAGVGLDKGAWDRSTSVRITRSISNTPPGRTTKAGPAKRATARRPDDRCELFIRNGVTAVKSTV
ncbi:hypothetical protein VFPBJ_04103 [Purpureocillium lilacinum]|uniref:Uncharacterized protein n=1 Tax=Purpureocillium lilacinum TaxID=33203 RepID=A0A179GWK5_PURLI|nr:hypothetical protein VFPBJ_04103 [Purpureocillium lilacinum]